MSLLGAALLLSACDKLNGPPKPTTAPAAEAPAPAPTPSR